MCLDGQMGSPLAEHTVTTGVRRALAPYNGSPLLVPEKEQTFYVLLFKMQQCKGHRGGDATQSCNKEGEIKNNDRNKLS